MIELERTFLAKSLPSNLMECENKEIEDLYIENGHEHADLRLRKNGDTYEITKKKPVDDADVSKQIETTIHINEAEYNSLAKADGKRVAKTRYYFEHNGRTAEFDVFSGELEGLVLVDFEFDTEEERDGFEMPDFCLKDITQEEFIAGGLLAGKSYGDIKDDLKRFNYNRL
tara:strand:- start:212 stop:724 length:513 start_codon:yes stop_codon:yes gene_type:complete